MYDDYSLSWWLRDAYDGEDNWEWDVFEVYNDGDIVQTRHDRLSGVRPAIWVLND